jgi:hypothetical protein
MHGLREKITEDKNRLFWKGIPYDLCQDIYMELIAKDPNMDWRKAAKIISIHKIALLVLDRDSVYADLAVQSSTTQWEFTTEWEKRPVVCCSQL